MSLKRFVYYSAIVGGWAAFIAWLGCEAFFLHRHALGGILEAVITGALVGAAIGGGLDLVSGMTNPQWKRQLKRLLFGLAGGGLGGAVGGLLGGMLYSITLFVPRAVGWMIMGLGIGAAEGIQERSGSRLRNGLLGGGLGGIVGGLLFDPIAGAASSMSGRATAFVILGFSVGALIGLTHVVLKNAWLTVVDGFRPGRELILDRAVTVLGRGDHLPLPFLGHADRDLESEHLRITRQPNGQYAIEDSGSRIGSELNGQRIQGAVALRDGDLIRLGTNIVRFQHRRRKAAPNGKPSSDSADVPRGIGKLAPPPPPPGSGPPGMPAAPPTRQPSAIPPGVPVPPPHPTGRAVPPVPPPAPIRPPTTGPVLPPPPPPPA